MAYGIIYKFRAETAKYKSDVKINILKNGYAGTSSDKYLGAGGVTLTKDSGGVICGTSLSFTAQADTDFEYLNFFESSPREYLVQLLIDDTIVWQGYLIGDEYREAFRNPPYDVAITATDGLGLLKNYDYTVLATPTVKPTRIEVVREILESTGLNLAISVSYDVVSGATKLFNVAFADDYFAGWSCYDVLEKMIPPDATITQHAGKWLIRRNEQDTAKVHTIYSYIEGSGYIITTGAGETALNLAAMGSGDVYPIGQAELNMQHAWNSMTVTSEHGKRPSFLYNHDFADGLTHWEESATTGYAEVWESDGGSYIKLTGSHTANSEDVPDVYIRQSFPYTSVDGHGFAFELKYCANGYLSLLGTGLIKKTNVTMKGRVEFTDGVDTYYLDETDGWTTNNRNFERRQLGNVGTITWSDFKIYTDNPPLASGTMTVYLYPLINDANITEVDVNFTDVVVHPYIWQDYPNAYEYPVTLQANATEKAEITILPTSVPDVANYDRMFYNGHSISGSRVDSFTSGGNTYTYTNLIINSLKFLHGTTRQLLTGYFRGAGLSLNTLINCAATAGRDYIVESGSWEVLNDKYNLNLLEIPGTATGSSWAVGTTNFASSAGWSDSHSTGGTGGGSSSGGGGVYTSGGGSWLDPYFELVNSGTNGEYIRVLRDFASTGEVTAYNANDITGSGGLVYSFFDLNDVSPTGFDGASGFYVRVNDAGTALEFAESSAATGDFATKSLDNLASVAINTSLIPDTDSTNDLGSLTKYWANLYVDTIYTPAINGGVAENDDITIQGTTHGTRTTSYVNLQPNGGYVGVGTTQPATLLHLESTGTEIKQRFKYNELDSLGIFDLCTAYESSKHKIGFKDSMSNWIYYFAWGTNGAHTYVYPGSGTFYIGGKIGLGIESATVQYHQKVTTGDVIMRLDSNSGAFDLRYKIETGLHRVGFTTNTGAWIFNFEYAAGSVYKYNFPGTGNFYIAGKTGIGTSSPTAVLHLKAGTATANTAPLKFTSGTLLGTPEAGAFEFLTDNYFVTITTGTARKGILLNDGTQLTSGKIPIATTNGRLIDGQTPLSGTKVYYVADSSGGAVTRKLTFIDGILTSET